LLIKIHKQHKKTPWWGVLVVKLFKGCCGKRWMGEL